MKTKTLIALASSMTATAFAGTATETMAPAPAPAPSPSLGGWFIGGSYGQLDAGNNLADFFGSVLSEDEDFDAVGVSDFDFDMYSLHVGYDYGNQLMGCDVSAYLEVGYLTGDASATALFFDSFGPFTSSFETELDIIPVTLNFKLERNIVGGLGIYGSAGLGYAFSDIETFGESERDGGFYAQASAGLVYNITDSFETYAGARWLYLESVGLGDVNDLELDNEFAWEVGLRYNF